jgi:probable rRNA maturation factor
MDDPSSPIEIIVEDEGWDEAGPDWDALAADLVARLLRRMPDAGPGTIAILLTDDAKLQELNRTFRGKDGPTNVLSFPAPPHTGALGDIAIAYGVCAREAEGQGKTLRDHAAHLILHGVLHLHGFDHEAGEEEAESMEALERAILAEIGVADPYQEQRSFHA